MVWQRHWKNVVVINSAAHMGIGTPNPSLEEDVDIQIGELLKLWGPVHHSESAYNKLAETLLTKVGELLPNSLFGSVRA